MVLGTKKKVFLYFPHPSILPVLRVVDPSVDGTQAQSSITMVARHRDPVSGPVFMDDGDNERWWELNRQYIDHLGRGRKPVSPFCEGAWIEKLATACGTVRFCGVTHCQRPICVCLSLVSSVHQFILLGYGQMPKHTIRDQWGR